MSLSQCMHITLYCLPSIAKWLLLFITRACICVCLRFCRLIIFFHLFIFISFTCSVLVYFFALFLFSTYCCLFAPHQILISVTVCILHSFEEKKVREWEHCFHHHHTYFDDFFSLSPSFSTFLNILRSLRGIQLFISVFVCVLSFKESLWLKSEINIPINNDLLN